MDRLRKYLNSRIMALVNNISKAEERLYEARKAENDRISRMGWGYGMRHSKINFSTSKSDRIAKRIASLRSDIGKMRKALEFVESMEDTAKK